MASTPPEASLLVMQLWKNKSSCDGAFTDFVCLRWSHSHKVGWCISDGNVIFMRRLYVVQH